MREALRQVKPTEFEDLIALVALYRPGPMQYIPDYAARKNGKEPVTYARPPAEADPQAARTGSASTRSRAWRSRKHLARLLAPRGRRPPQGDRQEDPLADGVAQGQVPRGRVAANDVRRRSPASSGTTCEKAQDYSFNKSHAACYALISYRTAWLRAHHPCEYMAALISSVMNTKDRVPFYVNACHELGIEVLPPDVNESQVDFAVVAGKIRFGLNAVKGVGELAAPHDHPGARARAGRSSRSGTSPSASTLGRQQARARVARQVRRARPARAWGCCRCSSRRSPTGRSSRPTGSPARARSSTLEFDEDDAPGQAPSADRPPRSSRRATCCGWRRRRSASTSPSIRCRRSATELRAQDRRDDRRARAAPRRRDRRRRRDHQRGQADDDQARRADGVPAARRRHRRHRLRRLQLDLRGGVRALRRSTGS